MLNVIFSKVKQKLILNYIILKDIIDAIISRGHRSLNAGRKGNKVLFLPNASEKIYLITMIIKKIGCFIDKYVYKYILNF